MIRKRAKRLAGAVLAAGAITAMPFQAFAQRSPEFAYSAEKWATLRDNKLEFDEIWFMSTIRPWSRTRSATRII